MSGSASLRCLCRGVRLTISGQAKGAVLCHCDNCKRATGSAFAHNARFMTATLDVQQGQDLIRTYEDRNTKSGNVVKRHFCTNCGTSLYLQSPSVPGLIIAHCGAIDGEDSLKPRFELFEGDRRTWMSKL